MFDSLKYSFCEFKTCKAHSHDLRIDLTQMASNFVPQYLVNLLFSENASENFKVTIA